MLMSPFIALTAIGVAAYALVLAWPQKQDAVAPTVESKQKVCAAFDTVSKAVQLQTHADLGPDPIAQTAVAGNARLSLIGGGEYLLSRLDEQTPPDLAEAVRLFAEQPRRHRAQRPRGRDERRSAAGGTADRG